MIVVELRKLPNLQNTVQKISTLHIEEKLGRKCRKKFVYDQYLIIQKKIKKSFQGSNEVRPLFASVDTLKEV